MFVFIYKGSNASKGQEMDSNQSWAVVRILLGSISEVIDPFRGLWTAPKPDSGHSGADFDLP